MFLKRVIIQAISLIAPPACPACGRPGGQRALAILCQNCRPHLAPQTICLKCGRFLFPTPMQKMHPIEQCQRCRQLPPTFDQARSLAAYQGQWKKAILAFKTRPEGDLLLQLSNLCRRLLLSGRLKGPWAAMVPVPSRVKYRLHAAEQLAAALAKKTGLPLINSLRFIRKTQPQRLLRRKARLQNLVHSMQSNDAVAGQNILLIDDVITTGATINECARALKQAGALSIEVLALAHGRGAKS